MVDEGVIPPSPCLRHKYHLKTIHLSLEQATSIMKFFLRENNSSMISTPTQSIFRNDLSNLHVRNLYTKYNINPGI